MYIYSLLHTLYRTLQKIYSCYRAPLSLNKDLYQPTVLRRNTYRYTNERKLASKSPVSQQQSLSFKISLNHFMSETLEKKLVSINFSPFISITRLSTSKVLILITCLLKTPFDWQDIELAQGKLDKRERNLISALKIMRFSLSHKRFFFLSGIKSSAHWTT